jgi:hypothetical protein
MDNMKPPAGLVNTVKEFYDRLSSLIKIGNESQFADLQTWEQ